MRSIQVSLLALCGGLSLGACRGGDSEQPPVHIIHNMDTQEKGKAYRRDTSGLFADGRVMRAPVEGTVAQGELDDDDVLYEGVNEKKEPTKAFPDAVKTDGKIPDSLADRGHLRYNIYCTPCHGAEGDGHGAVAGLALDGGPRLLVPPPAFTSERLMGMVAGYLPWLMYTGRTVFQFYSIAFEPYLILALTLVIGMILGTSRDPRDVRTRRIRLVAIYFALVLVISAFYYPLWAGIQLDYWAIAAHWWLPTWR